MGRTGVGTLCLWLCAVVCLAHEHNSVNVALNKTYNQSSMWVPRDSPSWAANGNTSGLYSAGGGNCIHTVGNGDPNPWWEVDLGRTYPVHDITVWARTDSVERMYPSNITVDGQLCASISYMDDSEKNVTCPSVMYGRRVNITRHPSQSLYLPNMTLNLCEMQIWVPLEVSECEAGRYGTSCDRNCSDHCGKGPGKNFCYQSSEYCYDGCVSGKYGDQCSTDCSPGCQNTTCDRQSGQCSPCKTHYTGDKCSGCVSGWYGDQCSTVCSPGCQNTTCDRQSGQCTCKAGYTGDTCSECEDTYYNTSSGTCVQCSVNCLSQSCEDGTGTCNGCVSGWYGDQCSTACSPRCQDTCDQQSGHCSCKAGYTGDTCTECDDTYYNTSSGTCVQCSVNCLAQSCEDLTGKCNGCVSGWYRDQCSTACSPGCQNTMCDQQSGICSCKAGYIGDTCTGCDDSYYNRSDNTGCDTCRGTCQSGTVCDKTTGFCPLCPPGKQGHYCEQEIKDGNNIAVVAGAAGAAVLVIIIVVVIVVFIMRRRRRGTKARGLESRTSNTAQNAEQQEEPERPASSPLSFTAVVDSDETKGVRPKALVKPVQAAVAKPKPTEADGNVYQNVSPQRTSVSTSPATSHARPVPENGTATSESRPLSEPLTDYEELEDLWGGEEPIYSNDPAYTNFIRVDQLQKTIVDSLQDGKVAQEFAFMAGFKQYTATIGRREESKNRYKSIVPYDKTRVILDQVDGDDSSDYINASFVKGYTNEKAYIAAQGPKSNTQDDFWRMVWQEGVTDIVMLTNIKEGNKPKCHEYWPAKGTSLNTGHMEVTGLEEEERAHFVIRTFNVQQLQNQEQRQVRQYHYIKWMDHEVPSTTPLVNFWRYVRARAPRTPTAPPLLVHCSAGVGRTGTYIALDILIDQTQEQEDISLYHTVDNLRKYRCHMVQNKSQYKFLHEAVLEAYMSGDCRLQTSSFDQVFPSPIHHDQPHPRIDDEFRRMCQMRTCLTRPSHTVASLEENRHKNRNPDALPDDNHLVYITEHTRGRNQYINAVYLPTFLSSRGNIVTQLPLADTVIDLWRLVDSWNVSTIVSIGQVDGGKGMSCYWPKALGQPVKCGAYVISMKSVNPLGDALHSYSVEMKKQNQSRELRVLHYEAWTGQVADNVSVLLRLLDTLHTSHTQSTKEPIIIQCIDGVAQSGAVCALWDVISRMTCDGEVDVYQAVRHVHTVRPEAVTSVVQYRFIFEVTQQYRNARIMYANM